MTIEITQADYSNARHQRDIPELLDRYASDPMGGGRPLQPHVKAGLVNALAQLPHAFSVIAYVDDDAAGLINCFEGFSTFECRPLVNIHDVVVLEQYRGRGISRRMVEQVERIARAGDCCKLTLEVLAGNRVARAAYRNLGFAPYALDPEAGIAEFWQKPL